MKFGEMEQMDVKFNYNSIINLENYGECYF